MSDLSHWVFEVLCGISCGFSRRIGLLSSRDRLQNKETNIKHMRSSRKIQSKIYDIAIDIVTDIATGEKQGQCGQEFGSTRTTCACQYT